MTAPTRMGHGTGERRPGHRTAFEADLQVRLAWARAFVPRAHQAEFDAVLAHARDGHHGWTMLWSSLSPVQRRLMSSLGDVIGPPLRVTSGAARPATGQGSGFRTSTCRALAKRGLLDRIEPVDGADWLVTDSAKGRAMLAAMRSRN